mmetsp:Transcript_7247/g.30075  ORF Transcript_7247/g.30075 Transcript_7247/m.30075 type:complete len:250 (+) Transcript_7247:340-1089(+)
MPRPATSSRARSIRRTCPSSSRRSGGRLAASAWRTTPTVRRANPTDPMTTTHILCSRAGHVEFWDRKLGDRACWASNGTDVLWIDGPRFIRPRPVGRDGSGGGGFVELALDKLHKDDISGGPPLGVVVHHDPPLDPLFCEQHKYEEAQKRADKSEYDANLLAYFMKDCSEEVARRIVKDDWDKWEPPLTLINYLRKSVLEAGGFPGLKDSKYISKSLIEAGIFSGMNLSGDWEDFEPHRLELIADLEPF